MRLFLSMLCGYTALVDTIWSCVLSTRFIMDFDTRTIRNDSRVLVGFERSTSKSEVDRSIPRAVHTCMDIDSSLVSFIRVSAVY